MNVNEPPVVVSGPKALTRRENSDVFLGAYEARDPDAGDTASWGHLEGDDADHFEIDASGRLSFRTPPDFEARANNVYQVIVVASDDGGLEARREVMVTVEDVNEQPVVMGTKDHRPRRERGHRPRERQLLRDRSRGGQHHLEPRRERQAASSRSADFGELSFAEPSRTSRRQRTAAGTTSTT